MPLTYSKPGDSLTDLLKFTAVADKPNSFEVGMHGYLVAKEIKSNKYLITKGVATCQILIVHKAQGSGALGHFATNLQSPEDVCEGLRQMIENLDGPPVDSILVTVNGSTIDTKSAVVDARHQVAGESEMDYYKRLESDPALTRKVDREKILYRRKYKLQIAGRSARFFGEGLGYANIPNFEVEEFDAAIYDPIGGEVGFFDEVNSLNETFNIIPTGETRDGIERLGFK